MKKALLIAINTYVGAPLRGCINDSVNMKKLLESKGFEVIVLHEANATRNNIINALNEISTTQDDSSHFILHYSGHGSQIPSTDPDESDHLTEILCPYDLIEANGNWSNNYITDNELSSIFSAMKGSIECFFDCCHSGTITRDLKPMVVQRYLPAPISEPKAIKKFNVSKNSNVICWSGCRDDQTSADAYIGNSFQGAFTAAFLQSSGNRLSTHKQIIEFMVNNGYTQVPQLLCDDELKLKHIFE